MSNSAMTNDRMNEMLAGFGFALTSGQWLPNVQLRTRIDLGAQLLWQVDADTKILAVNGKTFVSRAGKAAQIATI